MNVAELAEKISGVDPEYRVEIVVIRLMQSQSETVETVVDDVEKKFIIRERKGTGVEEMKLPVRAFHLLNAADIHTQDQLVMCTEKDLLNIRGFREKFVREVKEKLQKLGFSLRT
jgi:DNA-directed RNA polymerase alpha subunit